MCCCAVLAPCWVALALPIEMSVGDTTLTEKVAWRAFGADFSDTSTGASEAFARGGILFSHNYACLLGVLC